MVYELFEAKVPGSLMLFGEHAVLHGSQAVACAVNRFVKVTLAPRKDKIIEIVSDKFGNCRFDLENLTIKKPFEFVLSAIKFNSSIQSGFDLTINSDVVSELGLGSSAAVTVAVLKVLADWLHGGYRSQEQLIQDATHVIQEVQGFGSGTDAAASAYGGLVIYRPKPFFVEKLLRAYPITVIYSGAKKATREVVKFVEERRQKYPELFAKLFHAINECVTEAVVALKEGDLYRVGELMTAHQGLQDALGVNNALLSEIVYQLRAEPGIYGAKISGSGLGDCVVGLGELERDCFPKSEAQHRLGVTRLPIKIAHE